MKNYLIPLLSVILAGNLMWGCKWLTNRTDLHNSTIQEEVISQTGTQGSAADDGSELTALEEFEAFYHSLPELQVPLSWNSEEFLKGVPVPERIYRSHGFGIDYPIEVITAVRLPEKDGVRSIIFTKDDEDGFQSQILYLFRAGTTEPTYVQYIYNVREVDGGQNNIITSFEIDRLMGIELKTIYAGQVENGEFGRVLFAEEYRTITEEGELETLINMEYGVVSYTEEEDTVFGESFPSYKFTVSHHKLCLVDEDDPDTYELREVQVERYVVNDEGWLVQVESFD